MRVLRLFTAIENRIFDILYARKFLTRKTPAIQHGCKDTVSTDWYSLVSIFKLIEVDKSEVLIDIGCGLGRVLIFWSKKYPSNRIVGYELNPIVFRECKNILTKKAEIYCRNVLLEEKIYGDLFFLFNPFGEKELLKFTKKIIQSNKKFKIVYFYPVHIDALSTLKKEILIEIIVIKSRVRAIHQKVVVITKK